MTLVIETMEHRTGVEWWEMPKPRRFRHKHRWETRCWDSGKGGFWIERCSCGATQFSDLPGWIEEREPRFLEERKPRFRPSFLRSVLPLRYPSD